MLTGLAQVWPPSVERLTKTVGTSSEGVSGIEEMSQVPCAASKATDGSLTRSYGLGAPELDVMPGRNPGAPQVAPPSVERTNPMSVAPPSKKRPTWKAATTVPPAAKVSGSTSVACWLVGLVKGSELTRVSGTFAAADAEAASRAAAASAVPRATTRPMSVGVVMGGTLRLCRGAVEETRRLRSGARSRGRAPLQGSGEPRRPRARRV